MAATLYVAYLCYPNDDSSRQRFITSAAALFFKFLRDEYEIYVPYPLAVLRIEASQRTCRGRLNKAHRILIEKRIPVSEYIACAVCAARLGYPGGGPRNLITAINEHSLRVGRDPDNVRQREWYPTRPVAHMTLGFLIAVDWDRYQGMSLMELMFGPDPIWVEKAIEFSNEFLERLIRANVISDDHSPIVIRARDLL